MSKSLTFPAPVCRTRLSKVWLTVFLRVTSYCSSIPAIDTCHAGDADDEKPPSVNPMVVGARDIKLEVIETEVNVSKTSASHPQDYRAFDLMKSLFVNLDKGSGAVVISVAAADQYALD